MQLRFHPILKVAEKIADFQERIRPRFPGFDVVDAQNLEMTPLGVQVRNERAHRFSAVTEPTAVNLGTSSVALEYGAHESRGVLLQDLDLVMAALEAVYAPLAPLRLGVRYVNLIEKRRIATALNRPNLRWDELLTAKFATVPGGIAEWDDVTTFMVEVTSPCSNRGKMTVRYGVVPDQVQQLVLGAHNIVSPGPQFRLDTDRYIDGPFKSTEVRGLASEFVEDIFQVFMTSAGPALLDWMNQGGE